MSDVVFAFWTPGPMEIGIIMLIALLLFGAKLPKMAANFGKSFFSFKRGLAEGEREFEEVKAEARRAASDTANTFRSEATGDPQPVRKVGA